MGEFIMIMILSVCAVYGIFDILYGLLFSGKSDSCIRCVIIDDIKDKNPEYNIMRYKRTDYEIIIVTDKKWEYEGKKFFADEKIHILDREFFTKISADI